MKNRWKLRAMSWFLAVVMVLTSSGINSLTAMAASVPVEEEQVVEEVSEEIVVSEDLEAETEAEPNDSEGKEVLAEELNRATDNENGVAVTYEVNAKYTSATLDFKLDSIKGFTLNNNSKVVLKGRYRLKNTTNWNECIYYEELEAGKSYAKTNIPLQNATLTPGKEYELQVELSVDNSVKYTKVISFTTKTITIDENIEKGVNSAKITFVLPEDFEKNEFYLHPYIKIGDKYYKDIKGLQWQQNLKGTTMNLTNLVPGVKYTVSFRSSQNADNLSNEVYAFDIQLPALTITGNEKDITWFSAKYDFTVAEKSALAEKGFNDLSVYPFIQEKGGVVQQINNPYNFNLLEQKDITLKNLKEDTEYTLYLSGDQSRYEESYKTITFRTIPDSRVLKKTAENIYYCKADITANVSGSVDGVQSVVYLFYRKEGTTDWLSTKKNDGTDKVSFTKTLYLDGLDQLTKYEYVLAIGDDWNINTPDAITKANHKISGTFTTPADPRELKAVSSAGYETAQIRASYTGNSIKANTVVHVFYREEGTQDWNEDKGSNSDEAGSLDIKLKNLKQDTKYEYKVLLNSKWNDTTVDDEAVKEAQRVEGTFTTKKCTYELKVTANEEKSLYNREYLDVQLTGSKEDREVTLKMDFDKIASAVTPDVNIATKELVLYRDENYKDSFSIKGLYSETTYYVTGYSLWVKEFGETVCIKDVNDCAEEDYAFTTPKAVAPNSISLGSDSLYLNLLQAEEETVGYEILTVTPNTAEASDEVKWESSDVNVAVVDVYGKVTATGVGTAVITATSIHNENAVATCNVTVDRYFATYKDDVDKTPLGSTVIKGFKGDTSDEIVVYHVKEDDTLEIASIKQADSVRESVASYDTKKGVVTFGLIGSTKIYLTTDFAKGGGNGGNKKTYAKDKAQYRVCISAESFIKTASYFVDGLENEYFPGVKTDAKEDTYVVLLGEKYQISLKDIDGSDIEAYDEFDVEVSDLAGTYIEIDPSNFKLNAKAVTNEPVKVTITAKEGSKYARELTVPAEFYVLVKDIPILNADTLYVLTNKDKFLKDVQLRDGWEWEKGDTALYALRKTETYAFTALYTGDDYYPASQSINVNLAEIKTLTVEDVSGTNYCLAADGEDKITVKVNYTYVGKLDEASVSNLLVAKGNDQLVISANDVLNNLGHKGTTYFDVKAKTAGSFEAMASVFSSDYGEDILSQKILVTASDEGFVKEIKVDITAAGSTVDIEEDLDGTLFLDAVADKGASFDLKANAFDYKGNAMPEGAKFTWACTDKSVVAIVADKMDSTKAVLTVKGDGNALVTVKSADKAGATYVFAVEVKNIAPRVDGFKLTVNTALDYSKDEAKNIAYNFYGFTEIVEAYDNNVTEWAFYNKTKKTYDLEKEAGLVAASAFTFNERYGAGGQREIIPLPIDPDLKNGKYNFWIVIKTENMVGAEYAFPVTVTVVKKNPKVKAVSDKINTFYILNGVGDIAYTFTGEFNKNPEVIWADNAKDAMGFGVSKTPYYNRTKKKWCSSVDTRSLEMNERTVAPGTDNGTLEFVFDGYRESVTIANFKIKAIYKIPVISAIKPASTISMACGIDASEFVLYQKSDKKYIWYDASGNNANKYCFSSYKSTIEEVTLNTPDGAKMFYVYSGEKAKENLVVKLRSNFWREKVEVKHTINNVVPNLILEKPNMVFNWALPGMDTTRVWVKNATEGAVLTDLLITGKTEEAQKMVDDNVFTFTIGANKYLDVSLNYLNGKNITKKNITYAFNVVPVYKNTITGKEVTGKACVLKLKMTTKDPSVTVSCSGSIDIGKYPMNDYEDWYKNAIKLKYTFKDVNSNYEVTERYVVGDYAKFFEIWWRDEDQSFYLVPKGDCKGKLKANFIYNLQFECKLKMKNGVTCTVRTAKPYKLKLKQTATSLKITPKTQTMYLSNEEVTRYYDVEISNAIYKFDDDNHIAVVGGLDVNKDGFDDIVIDYDHITRYEPVTTYQQHMVVPLMIVDRDAISATAKGKKYSVPVEFTVKGADGVSKNIKTKISVTIKR